VFAEGVFAEGEFAEASPPESFGGGIFLQAYMSLDPAGEVLPEGHLWHVNSLPSTL
jgi:hypothetical protein